MKKFAKITLLSLLMAFIFNTQSSLAQTANFNVVADTICIGDTAVFQNTSTGAIMYVWDYGDGNKDTVFTTADQKYVYGWSANFTVTLVVFDGVFNSDTITNTIFVDQIWPWFSMSKNPACPGDEIQFSNWSWNAITYLWDFGDGSPKTTVVNPEYIYTTEGVFTVTLVAYNDNCNDTVTNVITIDSATTPTASFSMNPGGNVCPNEPIAFSNWSTDRENSYWDFDDGNTSTAQVPTHSYSSAGTYNIMLIVTNNCGNSDTLIQSKTVDAAIIPTASASASPNPVCPVDTIQFYGSGGAFYSWDFDDGNVSGEEDPKHTFADTGTYDVVLTVTNYCGNSDVANLSVNVNDNVAPTASAWTTFNPTCATDTVRFNGSNGVSFSWDFDDGDNSTEQNPKHVYSDTGTYNVTYIVTNVCGLSDTTTVIATVDTSVTIWASFWVWPSTFCTNSQVTFPNWTWGEASGYIWDFDDGNTSTEFEPTHSFAGTGGYNVTLTAYNACGDSNSVSQLISITDDMQPVADLITNSSTEVCEGEEVSMYNSSWDPNSRWDMGDGNILIGDIIYHKYAAAGTYTVMLTLTDSCGGDTDQVNVTVYGPPTPGFTTSAACNVITFTDASTGTPTTWYWDFGDANTSSAQNSVNNYGASGDYTVTLSVTNAKGCSDTLTTTVNVPAIPTVTISKNDESCSGANDGDATANVSGGTPSYNYLWNTGAITQAISSLSGGVYAVTVTDASGCIVYETVTITTGSGPSITMTKNDASCGGISDGDATATPSGGVAPYTYLWNNGGTTQTISSLGAGTYAATVTDVNGCSNFATIAISAGGGITLTSGKSDASCGQSNGTATVTATGGTPAYTYSWSNGATTQSVSGLAAATYYATVTDANGCSQNTSVTLSDINNLSVAMTTSDVTSCGGSDGTATGTPSGGTPSYSYSWSDGQTTQTASNLTKGTYTVTVTDAGGCQITGVIGVSENKPGLNAGFTYNGNQCFTGHSYDFTNTGSMGGGVSWAWDFGPSATPTSSTNEDEVGVTFSAAGSYVIEQTVTKAGCDKIEVQTIVVYDEPTGTLAATDEGCASACDGSIDLTVSGGTAPFTYSWTGGATTEDVSSLCPALYTVNITDVNSCTGSANVTINAAPGFSISIAGTDASCAGICNGSGDLTVSGGSAPFTYLWTNGATTEDVSSLCAAGYSVDVTDNNGCLLSTGVTINNATTVSASIVGTNPNCNGGCDGSADLTVSGGTPSYTYNWSDGSTAEDPVSLCAGTYDVTVTDANGCQGTGSVTLTAPTAISLATGSQDANCGAPDGTAGVTATGGTPGYTYIWSNGQTSQAATSLVAAAYGVTVSDANGCKASTNVNVSDAGGPSLSVSATDATCNGGSDGSASAVASGGTLPYTYLWSDGQTTAAASGLISGSYNIEVTDGAGCKVSTSVNVNEPTLLSSFTTSTDVACNSGTDGDASITPSGGTLAYSYSWSTGATSQSVNNLIAATYQVTVTDANGCMNTHSVTINEPSALSASIVGQDLLCNGDNSGAADLTISGGTTGYTYDWSNGETTEDLSGLTAGNYDVTITDANGCKASANVTISEPSAITLTTGANDANCGVNDGDASVTASGGTAGYTYVWDNGQTSQTATSLLSGTYIATVTDANGCVAFVAASVNDLNGPSVSTSSSNVTCNGGSNGDATATATGGTAPYTYSWSNGATTVSTSSLSAGIYSILVTDASSCNGSGSVTITEPAAVSASLTIQDLSCNGDNSGTVDLTVSGGTPGYTYNWSNGATSEDLSGVAAGSYDVTITDANGCTGTGSVTISEPANLSSGIAGTDASCVGNADGDADLTVTGGNAPYSYTWSNGATTEDAGSLTAGDYGVVVADANGCSVIDSVTISDPSLISLVSSASDATCGSTDGSASVVFATGGAGGYTYIWSDGQTSATASSLASGVYNVTVLDANDCFVTEALTVNDIGGPSLTITITNATCGLSNGALDVTPSGGTAPYTYAWSDGQTTQTASSLTAGGYTVEVTDAGGCKSNGSVSVTTSAVTYVDLGVDSVLCTANGYTLDAGSNGSAYLWSTGEISQTITVVIDGTYLVAMTDTNGCLSYDSTYVTMGPVAGFSHTTSLLNASFVSSSTNVTSYDWDFGDSNTSSDPNPSNTYAAGGTYTVTLLVSNSCGSDTTSVAVTVADSIIGLQENDILTAKLQAYPNPYKGSTFIQYDLPENAHVTLEVYNVLGKKVITIVDENQLSGRYFHNFSAKGSGHPEGVYIVRLKWNDNLITNRIIEMR
ncbi:PKD domain-containing protein [Sphingobacteriaceae bacterium AH-315-L07]|nr:PKD domain-containing protein [Sphingobacteriaceae bacterium AH-315-L07]